MCLCFSLSLLCVHVSLDVTNRQVFWGCVFLSLQKMPGSVGAVAAAKKKKKSGTEHLEKAFEKADISSDGKVSLL